MAEDEPLRQALRAALEERSYSIRGFARACAEVDPRGTGPESWRRTIMRTLEDREIPYTPTPETARLWAKILRKPNGYFIRQPARVSMKKENERLREENRRLRAELERRRREHS